MSSLNSTWKKIGSFQISGIFWGGGSAELCFLYEWILGPLEWEEHYQTHLDSH